MIYRGISIQHSAVSGMVSISDENGEVYLTRCSEYLTDDELRNVVDMFLNKPVKIDFIISSK